MTDSQKVVNRNIALFASAATDTGLMNKSIDSKQLPALKEDDFEYVQTAGPKPDTNDEELAQYNTDRNMITSQPDQPTEPDSATKQGSLEFVGGPDIAQNQAAQQSGKPNWLKWFVILILGMFMIISCFKLAEVGLTKKGTMPAEASAGIATDVIAKDTNVPSDDPNDTWIDDFDELNDELNMINELSE